MVFQSFRRTYTILNSMGTWELYEIYTITANSKRLIQVENFSN